MAIRGRKPKPIALRKLEGNPGKRPLVKRVGNSWDKSSRIKGKGDSKLKKFTACKD